MLESIINLLQKFSNNSKENSDNSLGIRVILVLLLIIPGLYFGFLIINGLFLDGELIEAGMATPFLIVTGFYLLRIGKVPTNKKAFRIFSREIIPVTILFFLVVHLILAAFFDNGFNNFGEIFVNILPIILVGMYPLIQLFGLIFKKLRKYSVFPKLEEISVGYNFMMCFLLMTHTLLTIFKVPGLQIFQPIQEFISELIRSSSNISGLLELGLIVLIILIIFVLQVRVTYDYLDDFGTSKKKFFKYLLIVFLILNISAIGNMKDKFYASIIVDAQEELQENGENYSSYKDAKGFFLEKAFLSQIKKGKFRSEALFAKIYDATPEEFYGEEIAEYRNDRRSFGTDSSKVGDEAKVLLNLAEVNSTIIEEEKELFVESEYIFHFENTDTINQEVILHFQTPNQYSVVTDLVLGLNGELQGQIAPRGAAKKVYEESLRRNIDPALIEKMGLNSYNLRVFPILGKNNKATNGKQKVAVTVLTPILENEFIYSPKFSYINLKTNEDSRALAKIYDNDTLIQEDIKKGEEVDEFLNISHSYTISNSGVARDDGVCYHPFLADIIKETNLDTKGEKELSQSISIFFDNSSSVSRNDIQETYKEIYKQIKNYDKTLQDVDTYSYNFEVKKVTDIDDIQYWGYTDTNSILEYITKSRIENQKIIIVTDDSSFNSSNLDINFDDSVLTSNRISVIKIGEKIKTYKSDFNLMLSATQGNIYEYSSENFTKILDTIISDSSEMMYKLCSTSEVEVDESQSSQELFLEEQALNGSERIKTLVTYLELNLLRMEKGIFFPLGTFCKNTDQFCNAAKEKENMHAYLSQKYIETNAYQELFGFDNSRPSLNIRTPDYEYIEGDMIKGLIEIIYGSTKTSSTTIIPDKNTLNMSDFVQAGYLSEQLLSQKNENNTLDIQQLQNDIAENFGIVNHYNSYIALETDRQQRDLDRYSEQENAFDVQYDNLGASQTVSTSRRSGGIQLFKGNESALSGTSGAMSLSSNGVSVGLLGGDSYYNSYNSRKSFSSDISFLGLFKLIIYIYFIYSYFHILLLFFKIKTAPVVHEKEAIAPITQASEIDRIHLELVALYENEMITELKQKCIMYMSKGYDDPKINFYLKKALEENNNSLK